jgi:hypothetical protein
LAVAIHSKRKKIRFVEFTTVELQCPVSIRFV